MYLSPDKGEACAKFKEETLDMICQRLFDLAFAPRVGSAQEIEQVGILKHLRGHIGVRRRHRSREVGDSLAVALMHTTGNLQGQDISAPSVFKSCLDIPLTCGSVLYFVQQ